MRGTASLILAAAPDVPEAPAFPTGLDWGYDAATGRFTLDEAGADRLLEFRDEAYGSSDTCGYLFDVETYKRQLAAVFDKIISLGL